MSVFLAPVGNGQVFLTAAGLPAAFGFINTYLAGTTTPAATFTTSAGNIANAQPIPLTAAGMAPFEIWLTGGQSYKFIVTDAALNPIGPPYDNLSGIGDLTAPNVNNAANVSYTAAGSNAVLRTVASKLGEWISVKDFGAKCDSNSIGTIGTDDTTAINNALAVLTSGQTLLIPGFSLISGALNVTVGGIRILGMGPGVSGVITNSGTADIFTVSSALADICFENFSVWSTITKSAGNCFTLPNAARHYFNRVDMGNRTIVASSRLWRGIDFQGCDDSNVRDCTFCGIQNEGIRVYGVNPFNSELRITGCRWATVVTGIRCAGNFGGLYVDLCTINTTTDGIVIDQTQSATVNREIYLGPDCILDGNGGTNLNMAANGCTILHMTGTWLANGPTCISIAQPNHSLSLHMTGCRLAQYTSGLVINDCAEAFIVGCSFFGNSAGGGGISLGNSALGLVQITGGRSNSNTFGIFIAANVSDYIIRGMQFDGNSNSNVSGFPTTPTSTQVIAQCVGFISENSGSQTLTAAATTTTVTHGLGATPNIQDIVLTAQTSLGAAAQIWVTSPTSTQFTINTNANPGAGVVVGWRVKLPGV